MVTVEVFSLHLHLGGRSEMRCEYLQTLTLTVEDKSAFDTQLDYNIQAVLVNTSLLCWVALMPK